MSTPRPGTLATPSTAVTWSCPPSGEQVAPQPAWMAFTGQSADEMLGTGWTRAVHPDDLADVVATWREAVELGRPYIHEHRIRRHDGEWRWMSVSAAPVEDARGHIVEWVGINIDITERIAAQQASDRRQDAIEQERQRFAALVEQSNDLIGFTTLDGRALYVNRATSTLLGLPPLDSEPPVTMADLTSPEDREMVARDVLPRVLAGQAWRGELRIRHFVTGESIPTEQVVFPLTDPLTGTVAYIATIARDMRERIETDRRLRQSETDYRLLFEASAVCNAEAEWPVTRITRVNARFCELLGYDEAELLGGMTFTDLTHPDDRARTADTISTFLRERRDRFELDKRYIRKNGEVVWVHLVGTLPPRASDGRLRLVGSAVDITDRRRTEQLLRENEWRFQTAAEAVNGFIYDLDVDRQLITLTIGAERLLGIAAGEPLPQPQWVERIHIDDLPRVREEWTNAWRGDGRSSRSEYRVRHRDGHYIDVWDNAVLVRDPGGRVVRAIGHVIDISDRRKAEQSLIQADRKKNEFLAVLAHELRNPLAPIRNSLQIMKLAANDPDAVERAQAVMSRQIEQLTHLVDDLMDVSRISQGRIAVRKQRMRLADAVRNALDSATPLVEASQHQLVYQMPADDLWVDGDVLRLSQVFTNILNNAAKYTPQGGVIRVNARRDGTEALVSVEDNGIGIPADMLGGVFEMFVQVDRANEVSRGGLGLGLHIAKRLVAKHGGAISVESAGVGQGSRFTVRLPLLVDGEATTHAADTAEASSAGTGRRVLVVDDNVDAATSLTLLLDLMGHRTEIAHNGHHAITLAESFQPHVILMDIGMPGLSGYDACRRIRDTAWGRSIVIIAQTGWGNDDDRRRASEAGFDGHLTKPIDPLMLARLLAEAPPS